MRGKFMSRTVAALALAAGGLGQAAWGQTSALKIYQIYGGSGTDGVSTYTSDFVVLFNSGSLSASLNGTSLQYSGANGVTWTSLNLPDVTVAPGAYYLVRMGAVRAGLNAVPGPDFAGDTFGSNLAVTAGKLALVNSIGNASGGPSFAGCIDTNINPIIDVVSYGLPTGSNFCTQVSAMSGNLSTTTWATRINQTSGGFTCPQDTDDTGSDFVVGSSIAPRWSGTPATPCSVASGSDLAVQLAPSVTQINLGQGFSYTATVSNFGPSAATGFTVSVTLPSSGVSVNAAGTTAGFSQAGNVVSWAFAGSLASGQTRSYTVSLNSSAHVVYSASAALSNVSPADPQTSNNTDTAPAVRVWDPASGRLFAGQSTSSVALKRVDVVTGASQDFSLGLAYNGLAADDTRQVFWATDGTDLYYVPYYVPTPVRVGRIAPDGTTGINQFVTELAAGNGVIYAVSNEGGAVTPPGLYAVDPQSARTTQAYIWDLDPPQLGSGNFDLGGADFNPADGKIYAWQRNATGYPAGAGIGLYAIDPVAKTVARMPNSAPSPYPGYGVFTIDGMGVGDGKAYFVIDRAGEVAVYDLATQAFTTSLPSPFTSTLTGAAGAYTSLVASPPVGMNLGVDLTGPARVSTTNPSTVTYVLKVTSFGPQAAGASTLVLPLPAGLTLVSAPGGSVGPSSVTYAVPALTLGASQSYTVTFTASGGTYQVGPATLTGGGSDLALWNNTSRTVTTVVAEEADLAISGGVACASAGSPGRASFVVTNVGAATAQASTLSVSVPAEFGFTGSSPAGSFGGGQLDVPLGAIAPGAAVAVTISGVPTAGATLSPFVSTSTNETVFTNNNIASTYSLYPSAFTPSAVQVLLTTVPTGGAKRILAPSNTQPAGAFSGAVLTSTGASDYGFTKPFLSPNGQRWAAFTVVNTGRVLLLAGTTSPFTAQVVAEQNVTPIDGANVLYYPTNARLPDENLGINDSGQIVFSSYTPVNDTKVVVRTQVGVPGFTVVARSFDLVPGVFVSGSTAKFGTVLAAYGIRNNGNVVLFTQLDPTSVVGGTPVTSSTDGCILEWNGSGFTLVAREGDASPVAGRPYLNVPSPAASAGNGAGLLGTSDIFFLATLTGSTSDDGVAIYNNTVAARDGDVLGGFTLVAPTFATLSTAGDRLAYGASPTAGDTDWVTRNGQLLSRTGGPIFAGSTLSWADDLEPGTFLGLAGNGNGQVAVAGGITSGGDAATNTAIVSPTAGTLLVRENQAIDLNGNGVFDDGVFLGTIRADKMSMTPDGWVWFVARVRDNCSGLPDAQGVYPDVGSVLARVQVPVSGGVCCRGATCVATTQALCVLSGPASGTQAVFRPALSSCAGASVSFSGCCYADYDKNGSRTIDDIFIYLNGWFAGSPYTKVGGDGSGSRTIDDIFLFLNAWFAGCNP